MTIKNYLVSFIGTKEQNQSTAFIDEIGRPEIDYFAFESFPAISLRVEEDALPLLLEGFKGVQGVFLPGEENQGEEKVNLELVFNEKPETEKPETEKPETKKESKGRSKTKTGDPSLNRRILRNVVLRLSENTPEVKKSLKLYIDSLFIQHPEIRSEFFGDANVAIVTVPECCLESLVERDEVQAWWEDSKGSKGSKESKEVKPNPPEAPSSNPGD